LEHTETKKYVARLKQSWQDSRVIREESFNVIINSTNYGVTVSSPLLILFLEKKEMTDTPPPIHIEVVNEEKNKVRKVENKYISKMATQLKQIEKVINKGDADSTTASTKSSASAINILSNFAEANSVSTYRRIQVVFFLIIACCLGTNIATYLVSDLEWDNTNS